MNYFFHLHVLRFGFVGLLDFFLITKSDVMLWYECLALWVVQQSDSVFYDFVLGTWRAPRWVCMFNDKKFWRRDKRGKQWISVCTCLNVLVTCFELGKGWRKGKNSDVISSLNFVTKHALLPFLTACCSWWRKEFFFLLSSLSCWWLCSPSLHPCTNSGIWTRL